jgi:para-nitrobenzyl esterase
MSNNRRDFIKAFGGGAAIVGLGGLPVSSYGSMPGSKETLDEQILEISEKGAIVETLYGKVRGYRRNGIYTYKGIPYGASTAGVNRFMAPGEPEPWSGIRNALDWGPSAPQVGGRLRYSVSHEKPDMNSFSSPFTYHSSDRSYGEDCLRINVWSPEINDNKKRPVLVWFHGGGFAGGSSIQLDAYIGENLSKSGDVVVCSINHRLNGFGAINLAAIGGEKYKDSANAGMLDIVASLKWVNANIRNFGGDPGNVTIFGQSGGGGKVSTIMAMPAAKGLFHKAMTISGPKLKVAEYDKTAELANAVLKEAGIKASRLDKLQELPWMDFFDLIVKAEKYLFEGSPHRMGAAHGFVPCVDGLHIPQHPFDPSAPAISAGIPMIIGSCSNEMSPGLNDPGLEDITIDKVKEEYKSKFNVNANQIVDTFVKCFPDVQPIEIWGLMASSEWRIQALLQAERQTANGGPVYNYWFNWKTPLYDGRPGAYHNSDIAFWFNNTDIMDTITGGGARPRRLAEKMSQALISFARSGNPNHVGIPDWPKYDNQRGAVMIWDDTCEVKNDPDREARKELNEHL